MSNTQDLGEIMAHFLFKSKGYIHNFKKLCMA